MLRPRRRRERAASGALGRVRTALVAGLVTVILLAGCGPASPYMSFDPATTCTGDGRFPGAYPALEARLPASFRGAAPTARAAGATCAGGELGTLAGHGIAEVHFAGASWFLSGNAGITLAVFTGQGLTAEWLGEWDESSARAARH